MKRYAFSDNWSCNGSTVTLPHDAMIFGERKANAPGGSGAGYFSGGKYIYEKKFSLPADWCGKHIKLQFEGVYKNAQVAVNDKTMGGAAYGYTPFWVDCGVLPEGENSVTVTCDNAEQPDSRWYSGAGIYRPVWAWVGDGITAEDVRITTVSIDPAVISVTVGETDALAEVLDGETVIARGCGKIVIPDVTLWSDENPYLYTCRVADQEIKFGIREIKWSNKGLFINGKETLLRGGCVHHDSGILGAATYDESEWRRVKIMKDAGYNALRSAHNPCSRAMLEACDYYGMYIMDESWDMWFHHKNRYDYAGRWQENYLADLKAMVDRDYNHPCVIMYSFGNELTEPASAYGVEKAKEMVKYLHSLDATRPVTGGINLMILTNAVKSRKPTDEKKEEKPSENINQSSGGMNSTLFNLLTSFLGSRVNKSANSPKADAATSPCLDTLDIAGYNYASGRYSLEGKCHPERVVVGAETLPQDIAKNWALVKQYPYVIGDFMWTAWDYLGEAGVGAWAYDGAGFRKPYPWLLADTGAFDILGNPTAEVFHAAAVWNKLSKPEIAVQPVNHPGVTPAKASWRGSNAIPSWSWRGCEGNKAVVEVYFDCTKVALLLNGKSLGTKAIKRCKATFKTRYVPGKLEVVAYDARNQVIARNKLETAKSADVHIVPEQAVAKVGQVIYVPIIIGDDVTTESNADRKLTVTVKNGDLLAFGSANPRTEERYHTGTFTTYYGRALAVVKATQPGILEIYAADKYAEILVK